MCAAFAHSLYDCVAEIDLIESTLEAMDDEDLSPELRAELERDLNAAIAGTREKIDRTASVLAAFEAAELAAAAEVKRLGARKDRIARQRERLEGTHQRAGRRWPQKARWVYQHAHRAG